MKRVIHPYHYFSIVILVCLIGLGGLGYTVKAEQQDETPEYDFVGEGFTIIEHDFILPEDNGKWQVTGRQGYLIIQLDSGKDAVEIEVLTNGPAVYTQEGNNHHLIHGNDNRLKHLIQPKSTEQEIPIYFFIPAEENISNLIESIKGVSKSSKIEKMSANNLLNVWGGGNGHRIGMSQWGAQGLTIKGVGFRNILNHYYPGTKYEKKYDDQNQMVTVTLDYDSEIGDGSSRTSWTINVPNGGVLVDHNNNPVKTIPANQDYQVTTSDFPQGVSQLTLQPNNKGYSIVKNLLHRDGKTPRQYEGTLIFIRSGNGIKLQNKVSLHDYLIGVVPYEAMASWEVEALKAQAVAARSYAAYRSFNMVDSIVHQAYYGRYTDSTYGPKIQNVVKETAGYVLTYSGKVADTVYSAGNGGWIEQAWSPAGHPYLTARKDEFKLPSGSVIIPEQHSNNNGDGPHSLSYYRWAPITVDPGVGSIQDITVERTPGMGARTVTVQGSNGTRKIDDPRNYFNRTSNFIYFYPFYDIENSYAKEEIARLYEGGVITGHQPEAAFKPNDNITRAEFAKLLAGAFRLAEQPSANYKFTDVHDWAKGAVGALYVNNITKGYNETTFGSNDNLTRKDMATFFVRALGYEEEAQHLNLNTSFKDLSYLGANEEQAKRNIIFATEIGLINGYNAERYAPNDLAKREQVARLAYEVYFNGDQYRQKAEELLRKHN
ncbi:peptidoglycan hydrolase-like amidase [Caldalkalibacillus uzonensis]|uniref:Peptidoglycan hydrolase-like amidase n=1 Tax=Caldalkalibacillus uzonensis TaxID=353224 RepID=A0ABU0CTX9_9BACI|nr:SpoIID/LytB domain-containing protein [Caldalkalibacillus uzonensis]MDQ0339880.1 peptidoglycan hydrolase-like amidase [Caldalkalibacillus uzonensis]